MHIIDDKKCSLKEASYDKENKIYMVDSELEVCNFDNIKEWYVQNVVPFANPNPKSNDALYFTENECYFIEFKNGKIDNSINYDLNKKIYDSLFILFDLDYTDCHGENVDTISYTRENMNYILVYNEERYIQAGETVQTIAGRKRQKVEITESQYRDKLFGTIRQLANEDFIKFGLDQFKNYLFKNVYTYTVKEFQEKFIDMQKS